MRFSSFENCACRWAQQAANADSERPKSDSASAGELRIWADKINSERHIRNRCVQGNGLRSVM